ncbi:MAG: HAD hydrolase family protein, partial [Paeniclostridium sordellii]|nr:HAD hydrolase family protein [Paeniclostridium sordellii]
MGNAIDKVKKSAQYITASNTDSGVAKAIEKFVLK